MAEPNHAQQIDWGQVAAYGVGLLGLKEALPKLWGWLAKTFETESSKRAKREEQEEADRRLERSDMISFLKVMVQDQQKRMDDLTSVNDNLRKQVNELLILVGRNTEKVDQVAHIAHQADQKANASMAINNPDVLNRLISQANEETK
jgi:hypothetical protein